MLGPIEIHRHAAEPIMVADPDCRWLTLRGDLCPGNNRNLPGN